MEEKQLNEKESLELISRMIRNTQNKLEANSGLSILIWGYVTVAVTIAVWSLIHITGNHYWHYLWFAIPVLGLSLSAIFSKKKYKSVETYVDRVVTYVWTVLGVGCFVFSTASFFTHLPILTIVLLLMGAGSMITGLVIRFPVLAIGGAISMSLSVIMIFIPQTLDNQLALFAIGFIGMGIVPGHILYAKAKSQNGEAENV